MVSRVEVSSYSMKGPAEAGKFTWSMAMNRLMQMCLDPNAGGGNPNPEVKKEEQKTEVKEFSQADVDRRVTEALKTREAKLKEEQDAALLKARDEAEKAKLLEAKKFEDLYQKSEAEKRQIELRLKTRETLEELKLGPVAKVFEMDLGTLEGRTSAAKELKGLIDKAVEERVAEKLSAAGGGGHGGSLLSSGSGVRHAAAGARVPRVRSPS